MLEEEKKFRSAHIMDSDQLKYLDTFPTQILLTDETLSAAREGLKQRIHQLQAPDIYISIAPPSF